MTGVTKTPRSWCEVSSARGMIPRPSFPSFLANAGRRGAPGAARVQARPLIKLKSPREISLMREAGRVVAKALDAVRRMAHPGVTTADMEDAVAAIFREHD